MNIQEVRAKYPQYSDLSDEALAKGLHAKFYADMPFEQFSAKIGLGPDKSVPDSAAPPAPSAEPQKTLAQRADEKLTGAAEAGLSLLSGATSGLVGRVGGTLGGLAANVTSGKYGTQEGAQMAGEVAAEQQQRFTYEPRTQAGKDALAAIGKVFEESKLEGLGPIAMPASAAVAETTQAARAPTAASARSAAATVQTAAQPVRQAARDLGATVREDWGGGVPAMPGMGAANTEAAAMRQARADSLPVPIKLTKGQAERTFEQQQFEREAAKNAKVGDPLRQRYAEQNEKILQNFDSWIDQTGAEAGSLRATGQAVTDAIVAKSLRAKAEINAAYKAARESGAMQERIDAAPLQKYLAEHQAEAINAPILTSVEAKLKGIADKSGTVSINDLEEVRKMVGKLSGKDATAATFGKEVKQVIDGMTEGKGGEVYQKARGLRTRYAQEFEDHAVVDKLLSFKPGTKDRAVAYEDVFNHSVMKGSLDDVRTIRKTLQTAGPSGQQAWRELQGATLQHIKDEITKNVQVDQAGNRVISPARLDRLVTELDKDGKLDFIFGEQGAQQIRDVNGIAQDVFTAPPGSVNHSNTASVLTSMIDKIAFKTTGMPFIGQATGYVSGEVKNAKMRAKVKEALQ
jgi:hypothetical protein